MRNLIPELRTRQFIYITAIGPAGIPLTMSGGLAVLLSLPFLAENMTEAPFSSTWALDLLRMLLFLGEPPGVLGFLGILFLQTRRNSVRWLFSALLLAGLVAFFLIDNGAYYQKLLQIGQQATLAEELLLISEISMLPVALLLLLELNFADLLEQHTQHKESAYA